jgi:hypothetical protein
VPRARSARFESTSGSVVVELMNDCAYAFPARLVQDLSEASDDELAASRWRAPDSTFIGLRLMPTSTFLL